jgi:hypothetical protein
MQHMTLSQFRAAVAAGGVLSVTLRAQGGAFEVQAETRRGDAVLIDTRHKAPRRFLDPRRALMLLRELGIRSARLDAEDWRPEQADQEKMSQPDSAAKLKATHEAAAHDAWFREQVQAAIDDPRPSIPHEEVAAEFAERRKALIERPDDAERRRAAERR